MRYGIAYESGAPLDIAQFRVVQTVQLLGRLQRPEPRTYQIVALLPVEQGVPQYRIKSVTEAHERRATESELRVVSASP
jgi:hypothetical protein